MKKQATVAAAVLADGSFAGDLEISRSTVFATRRMPMSTASARMGCTEIREVA